MPIPVIFQIATELGPGGFASLESAISLIQRVGAKTKEAIDYLSSFSEAYQRLEIDISEATRATKGLIEPMQMMAAANKLTLAELKPTPEQFAAISKGAVEMGDALGIKPTEAMDKLTDAIVRGNERALRPLGIELKTNGSLAEKQTEALALLVEKFKDLNVEADSLSDSLDAVANNIKTTAGLSWNLAGGMSGLTDLFNGVNTIMADHNMMLEQMNQGYMDIADIVNTTLYDSVIKFYHVLGNINSSFKIMAIDMERFRDYQRSIGPTMKTSIGIFEGAGTGMNQFAAQSVFGGAEPVYRKDLKTERRGGGGRGTAEEMTFTEEELYGPSLAQSVDDRIAAEEALAASSRQAAEEQLDQEQQYLEMQLRLMELKDADVEAMQAQQEQIDNVKIARMELQEVDARQIDLSRQIMEAERQRHDQEMSYVEQSRARWNASLENKLEMSSFFFNRMSLMQNTQTKAGFAIGKAAAVASTTIDTISGSIAAYKALAGIPYVGPALGVAAAAAVTAAGMAAVRQIISTSLGSTSSSTVSAGGGTSISTSSPGYSSVQPLNASPGQAVNVTVYLGEDNVYNAVEREDDRRSQRGARSFRA